MKSVIASLLVLWQMVLPGTTVCAGRFAASGPVLTVTVKDPAPQQQLSDESAATAAAPWLDIASLRPSLVYSVVSQQPPLPNWLPSLRSIAAGFGYQYNDLKRMPSWVESTAKFDVTDGSVQLQVQPSHELTTGKSTLLLQASRGAHYAFCRLSRTPGAVAANDSGSKNQHQRATGGKFWLEAVRASVLLHLPYASLATVRVTPAVDVLKRDVSCQIEAVTGGKGRTVALLNLEYEKPTLAVQYQPDSRNWIRPVVDLYTGRMEYQWILALPGGGSLHTTVDPSTAVTLIWTDHSRAGGTWVTDIRIPIPEGGTTLLRHLTADVRVRRQFRF